MDSGDLSIEYFILIQLAQDEAIALYNCGDALGLAGKGYYYDIVDVFNVAWKKLNRLVPKGEYQNYREVFCECADALEGDVVKLRDNLKSECEKRFTGDTELLSHLMTTKFFLKAADVVFGEMYGDGARSKLVSRVLEVISRFAGKFVVRTNSSDIVISIDTNLMKEFNTKLEQIAKEV